MNPDYLPSKIVFLYFRYGIIQFSVVGQLWFLKIYQLYLFYFRGGIIQPSVVGPDGCPQPVEHILELTENMNIEDQTEETSEDWWASTYWTKETSEIWHQ